MTSNNGRNSNSDDNHNSHTSTSNSSTMNNNNNRNHNNDITLYCYHTYNDNNDRHNNNSKRAIPRRVHDAMPCDLFKHKANVLLTKVIYKSLMIMNTLKGMLRQV